LTTGVLVPVAAVAGLALIALLVSRRDRGTSERDERVAVALNELGGRMDALARDLSDAIASLHTTTLRARALSELGSSLDLDEVLQRTLEVATGVQGVDGAIVHAAGSNGDRHVVARGLPDGAKRQTITGPPDGRDVRAVALHYLYHEDDEPPGALRSGVAVPLAADGVQLGFLAVYSHDVEPPLDGEPLERLEAIAAAAGPTIDTARRFREASEAGDHDVVTGLPGRGAFHQTLAREVGRAHRYQRRLALLVLDVDDFRAINERVGQLGGDEVLAATASLVRGAAREADVAYRAGGDAFAVILPESARIDAEGLFARVLAAVRRHQTGLTLSGGIAELQPDDDALTLYERAEGALHRAKAVGKGTAA
jgi:diguanylate cyclase (GGDEF)-like protein